MSPASKTQRRERALLAALAAAGGASVRYRDLLNAAAALGPDRPQLAATLPRMIRAGAILPCPAPPGTGLCRRSLVLPR